MHYEQRNQTTTFKFRYIFAFCVPELGVGYDTNTNTCDTFQLQ